MDAKELDKRIQQHLIVCRQLYQQIQAQTAADWHQLYLH